MKKNDFLLSAAILTLSFGTTIADDSSDNDYLNFDRVNTNGDDCVDWEEFRNGAMRFWDALDLNKDNVLAGDEHPEAVDANGQPVRPPSVAVTRYLASMHIAFDQADKDEDACLSRREYDTD